MINLQLVSCDNCAVLLDQTKLSIPNVYDGCPEGEEGYHPDHWSYANEGYHPMVTCPVCKAKIILMDY